MSGLFFVRFMPALLDSNAGMKPFGDASVRGENLYRITPIEPPKRTIEPPFPPPYTLGMPTPNNRPYDDTRKTHHNGKLWQTSLNSRKPRNTRSKPIMATRRVSQFGPEFEQLLLAAFADAPFRLPLTEPGRAQMFRAKFYHYCRTLREENLRLDLIEMADALTIVLENDCVIFQLKEDSWENVSIREALGLSKGFHESGNEGPGTLRTPNLLQNRLLNQINQIRERKAGGTKIIPPLEL